MYWLLSPEPDVQPLPVPSEEELILSPAYVKQNLNVDFLLDKLKISVEQQQAVWQQLRKGRLTASNFGVVLKAKKSHTISYQTANRDLRPKRHPSHQLGGA
eukprot:XP_011660480.1 PREDICTED: uncharacterized protein LOC105436549 [Strongylocentrotus purpuratus]